MSLYAEDQSDWTTSRLLALGLVAFVIATPLLWFVACPDFLVHDCRAGDAGAVIGLASLVELTLVFLLFVRRARWLTIGFCIAFLIAAAFTRGHATQLWLLPPNGVAKLTQPLWGPYASRRAHAAAEDEWAGVHRTQHPTTVHAARLVNALHECAARFRAADSGGGYPATEQQLLSAPECGTFAPLALDNEASTSRYTPADNGWRWSYTPGPADPEGRVTSYGVRVLEDPILARSTPEFSGDESGVVREARAGAPPAFVASPVASLVMLRRCLTRLPAENERLASIRGWRAGTPALSLVMSVCPELRRHISIDFDGNRDNGTLALAVHELQGELVDTAAVYTTEFIPADVDGLIFELRAKPRHDRNPAIHSGTRQFFIARDGSVHVSTGIGPDAAPATEVDPLAPECLPGGGVDCSVVQGTALPRAGS